MSFMTRAETNGEGHDEISEVGEVLWRKNHHGQPLNNFTQDNDNVFFKLFN